MAESKRTRKPTSALKMVIKVGGTEHTVSMDEAKKLYAELDALFGNQIPARPIDPFPNMPLIRDADTTFGNYPEPSAGVATSKDIHDGFQDKQVG